MSRFFLHTIGVLIAFAGYGNAVAQTPSAVILDDEIELCETEAFQIRIQFTGTEPFNAWIEFYNDDSEWLGERGPAHGGVDQGPPRRLTSGIYDDNPNMNDGVYTINTSFSSTWIQHDRKVKIRVVEFFHGDMETDWIIGEGVKENISGELLVKSYQMPEPFAGDAIDECGYNVTLNATPDEITSDYSWQLVPGASFGVENDQLTNPNALFSVNNDGFYQLIFQQTNGPCSAQSQLDVNLKGAPSGEIRTNSEVCGTGEAEVFVEMLDGYGPLEFVYLLNGNEFTRTGDPNTVYSYIHENVPGGSEFQLISIRDVNECFATADLIFGEAVIKELTPVLSAGEPDVVCGLIYTLNGWGEPGNGTWSSVPDLANFTDSESGNTPVEVLEYGDYQFIWSMENDGCVGSDDVTIRFVKHPEVAANLTNDVICEDDETVLSLSAEGYGPWSVTLNGTLVPFSDASFNHVLAPNETTEYQLTRITDTYGCFTDYSDIAFTLSVDQLPSPYAGSDREICGESILLSAVKSIGEGQWTGNGFFVDPMAPATEFYPDNFLESVSLTLRWTEVNGACTAYDEMIVDFYEPISEISAGADMELYHTFNVSLNALPPIVGVGTWEVLSGEGNVVDINDPKSEISGMVFGSVDLKWTVRNGVCAELTDELTIEVKGLENPTGFSPNEIPDGVNDRFVIKGASHISNNRLMVFNQTGELVFQEHNYGGDDNDYNDPNWWDGRDSRGTPVPEGTYYYVFTGDGIDPIKDYLVIKR